MAEFEERNEETMLTCPTCHRSFNSLRQLNSHKMVHSPKLIKCSKCGGLFRPGKEWFSHLNTCFHSHNRLSEETKRKISLAHKGKPTWIKGKHHSEDARRRMSLAMKGRIAWNKGLTKSCDDRVRLYSEKLRHPKNWSIEGKERLKDNIRKANEAFKINFASNSDFKERVIERARENGSKFKPTGKALEEFRKKVSATSKMRWQEKVYRENTIRAILRGLVKRPTSFEQKIIDLCEKYSLPFKYVGNGAVIINYVNPDFIATNNKKLLIETYCSFFHPTNYEEKRSERFAKCGYKTLFLNENDIESEKWEEICLNKIRSFVEGNKVLERCISIG